jgi:hypothetical protein
MLTAPKLTSADARLAAKLGKALPGIALAALGAAISLVARTQPAWIDGHIGPGLMAQLLGAVVIVLGVIWAAWCVSRAPLTDDRGCGSGPTEHHLSGPALLGAVLAFALCVPVLGLVLSAGLAATLAALGAGERKPLALLTTVMGLMGLTVGVGIGFLPPTAPLWPLS